MAATVAAPAGAGQRAYFTDFGSSATIPGFDVGDGDGALTPLAGPPASHGGGALTEGIVITPDAKRLFLAGGDAKLYGFAIAADGKLTPLPGSPQAGGGDPYGVTVTPDGKRVYLASQSPKQAGFSIGAGGALSPIPGGAFPPRGEPARSRDLS